MKQPGQSVAPSFVFRLDSRSGVPVFRQIIDQVLAGIASGALSPGDRLPTVRQVAVDLAINPNTVLRAYREMEIRGITDSQQGTGTFISNQKIERSQVEHERVLAQLVSEFVARAGAGGFTVQDLITALRELSPDGDRKKR